MGFGDVVLFVIVALLVVFIALCGAFIVGGLLGTGVFIARLIATTTPELWDRIKEWNPKNRMLP